MTTNSQQTITRDQLMAVDESAIRAICGERVFGQAESILAGGLGSPTREGLEIRAGLSGEHGWPLSIRIAFSLVRLDPRCNCRSSERFCAHVGALLLLWARRAGEFVEEGTRQDSFSIQRKWARESDQPQSPPTGDPRSELRLLLNRMIVTDLRSLGRRLELRLRGGAKGDLVEQLVAALSDPAFIERTLASLGSDLRLALAAIYALGEDGGSSVRQLRVALNRLVPSGTDGDSLVGELLARGLVFAGGEVAEPERYVVPSAYWLHLPSIDSLDLVPSPVGSVESAGNLADSLLLVWSSIRDRQLSLLARPVTLPSVFARAYPQLQDPGYLSDEVEEIVRSGKWATDANDLTVPRRTSLLDDSSLHRLAARVAGDEAAEFAWGLLSGLELVEPGESISTSEKPAHEQLWRGSRERLRAVLDAWLHLTGWSELDLALAASPSLRLRRRLEVISSGNYYVRWDGRGNIDEALAEARRFVLRVLALLPVGVWLSTESLLSSIWRMCPGFLYGEQGGRPEPTWWLEADGHRVDSARLADWVRGPGAVVTALVAGPLHWLGLADLAGPADRPMAFRLRPEARLLRGAAMPEESALAPVELGPDLEVRVAAGYPDAELREQLSTAGSLIEFSTQGFHYRLTPEGVRSLFDAGRSAEDLLALLESRAGSVTPQFRATIERWWRLYGQLRLCAGLTLVELSDDQILDELLAATSLRRHLIHRFTPQLIAVDPAGADKLLAELRGRGYMPLCEPTGRADPASDAGPPEANER